MLIGFRQKKNHMTNILPFCLKNMWLGTPLLQDSVFKKSLTNLSRSILQMRSYELRLGRRGSRGSLELRWDGVEIETWSSESIK